MRNAFGRLWWRAYVFNDPTEVDPWQLVHSIGEDQAVALLERPFISGHPPLARSILRAAIGSGATQQQDAVRDLTKRLLRLGGIVPLEALPMETLNAVVAGEFRSTEVALAGRGVMPPGSDSRAAREVASAPRPPQTSPEPFAAQWRSASGAALHDHDDAISDGSAIVQLPSSSDYTRTARVRGNARHPHRSR